MSSEPKRIQLSRARGWRKPEGAIVVSRPSKWGNPYRALPMMSGPGWRVVGLGNALWSAEDAPWTKLEAAAIAVERFAERIRPGSVTALAIEIELAGKDLACWCALDAPCHADVLLEIANSAALS